MADLAAVDIHLNQLRGGVEPRRRQVTDDVVDARADQQQQVGLAESGGPGGRERQRVIVGHHTATLRRGVERHAEELDQLLQLGFGLRPENAAAGQDQRAFRLSQQP